MFPPGKPEDACAVPDRVNATAPELQPRAAQVPGPGSGGKQTHEGNLQEGSALYPRVREGFLGIFKLSSER